MSLNISFKIFFAAGSLILGIDIFWECLHFFSNEILPSISDESIVYEFECQMCDQCVILLKKKANEPIRVTTNQTVIQVFIIIRFFFLFHNKTIVLPNKFIRFIFVHKHLALYVIYITTINDWTVMMEKTIAGAWKLALSNEHLECHFI